MKRKNWFIIAAAAAAALIAIVAGVGIYTATRPDIPVTPDQPLRVSIGGAGMNGRAAPGGEPVSAAFPVDLTDAGSDAYTLKITDVTFAKEGGPAVTGAALAEVLNAWQYKTDGGEYAALTDGATLADAAETKTYTLYIRALDSLDEACAGYTLAFTVELVKR
jgi:hypothetical protein